MGSQILAKLLGFWPRCRGSSNMSNYAAPAGSYDVPVANTRQPGNYDLPPIDHKSELTPMPPQQAPTSNYDPNGNLEEVTLVGRVSEVFKEKKAIVDGKYKYKQLFTHPLTAVTAVETILACTGCSGWTTRRCASYHR